MHRARRLTSTRKLLGTVAILASWLLALPLEIKA
jgi:hypothetical protein